MISVAQLKPFPGQDPYNRPRPSYPEAVEVESDTDEWRSYTVKRIIDKRLRKFGRATVTQYLVKWDGYGQEFNEWRSLSWLDNCLELVEEYEQRQLAKPDLPGSQSQPPKARKSPPPAKRGRARPRKQR